MGYAFLPIAIGYFIAGPLGGYLLHYFGDILHRPQRMCRLPISPGTARVAPQEGQFTWTPLIGRPLSA